MGPTLAEDGEMDAGVTHRVKGGWNLEELEESIWSVVCQEHEREDQWKVYRTVLKQALMLGAWKRNWRSQK